MIFALFASFIVFCLWLAYEIKKSRRKERQREQSFWELEEKANATRRKSLENLDYITLPSGILSMAEHAEQNFGNDAAIFSRARECFDILNSLSSLKIVNFTGLTNTELKLEYGAPNITLLTEYDQNYTLLVRTLQTLAEESYKAGLFPQAEEILEFAVSTGTDVRQSYFLLADLYVRNGRPEKIEELIAAADSLNTVIKSTIVRTLKESGPYSGLLRSL